MFDKLADPLQTRQSAAPAGSAESRPDGGDRVMPAPEAPAYAALDLGTNNCRLLVARPRLDANGAPVAANLDPSRPCGSANRGIAFEVIDAFSRIVRLGEGLDRSGVLSRPAMDRTIDALKVCAAKIRRRRVLRARQVATEACRRASNCQEFVRRVRGETGLQFEIISSAEEASLALAGCATLLDDAKPNAVVFDIGGGSTEVMWSRLTPDRSGVELIDTISLPFGVINLSEQFGGDRLSLPAFERMIDMVRRPLEEFEARHGIRAPITAGQVQMLGTSGTVTTLAGVRLGLPCYDRSKVDGCYLDFAEMREVTHNLLALDYRARAQEPCIGAARADLVMAGCAILEAICRTWPVGRLRVADRGVREGILSNLMRQPVPVSAGR